MAKEDKPQKFEQERGSVDSKINTMPWVVRIRYKINRAKADADLRAMERWAKRGFTAGEEGSDEVVHPEGEDVLW